MKRIKRSVGIGQRLSNSVVPFLLGLIFIPFLVLCGFGLYAIFKHGYVMQFLMVLFLSVVSLIVVLFIIKGRKIKSSRAERGLTTPPEESLVSASDDWGDFDRQVWLQLNDTITEQLRISDDVDQLRGHAQQLVLLAAELYRGKKSQVLTFSATEFLQMTEVLSRRYREILLTHVPYVERIQVSTLQSGYRNKEKFKRGYNSVNWLFNAYRVVRIINPVASVLAEIREKLIGDLFEDISMELQYKLKRALLQEVLSVSIDLYSGRFQVADPHLPSSVESAKDADRTAVPLDPLRVGFLGQVSAGKSTIINTLCNDLVAEVSVLPTTDKITVYQCLLEGMDALHLIDLPGIDGVNESQQQLLEQVVNCDIVLWVVKANQPAKSLDCELKSRLEEYFQDEKNRSRRQPAIIGVLNQVDRLFPAGQWQQPTAEEHLSPRQADIIQEAVSYNRELLKIETWVALAASEEASRFNLEALEVLLDQHYKDGVLTQLNRRRNENVGASSLAEQSKRLYQTGRSLFGISC